MNDYSDLMNEYQDVKSEITEQSTNVKNLLNRIQSFYTGIDNLRKELKNNLKSQTIKSEVYKKVDEDTIVFTKKIKHFKNSGENEIIAILNNLVESADAITKKNLDQFNEIKVALIQERQKLNKTKDDYINFIKKNAKEQYKNEDEHLLYNAKKQNYYQLYQYEVNQMNTIIENNNIKYEEMYINLFGWKEILKLKIKKFYLLFANYVGNIGNLFIEHSKTLINDINAEKYFDKKSLDMEKAKLKKPRFEKVKIEEINEKEQDFINNNNIINEIKINEPIETPLNAKSRKSSENNQFKEFSDFDIIDKNDLDLNEFDTMAVKSKKDSKFNIFSSYRNSKKEKEKEKKEKEKEKENKTNDISSKNKNNNKTTSTGFEEFEIVENSSLLQNKNQSYNEKFINDFIDKMKKKDELLSQDINVLMKLLKEIDPVKNKPYSYMFLTRISRLNSRYIINFNNKKNFIHLSNILNDISINTNRIDILKLIIDISQIIIYQQFYLFNLLQKKNKYFSTKTFWSKIIFDFFINDLNKKVVSMLNESKQKQLNNNDNNKNKEKDNNVLLLEFIRFSNNITDYKKLSIEQKKKLDKYARDNIDNVVIKVIEGMCSFLVQENIAIEVVSDFGKNFSFNEKDINYYKKIINLYMNRNYTYNLKQIPLKDEKEKLTKSAKICIISNVAKYLPKDDLLKLLVLEKGTSQAIKKNIFRNYLSRNISIDERTRIWGLMLKVKELKQEYNYKEIKQKFKISLEKKEIDANVLSNIGAIDLDVNRTFFLDKKKMKHYQEMVKYILVILIYIVKDISYFQGMNYIVSFLLQIMDYDEEKAFYYMLGIETNTNYKQLFEKKLHILQLFFRVFDYILKINIPEIHKIQVNNQINTNFYMPPWFLTLFTFFSTKFEKEKAPKFMIVVIERFFLDGWSAIFNAGYTIIKFLKNDLIKMTGDKLMNFLVNTLGQDNILKEENIEIVNKEYIKNSYQINEDFIYNILQLIENEKTNNIDY